MDLKYAVVHFMATDEVEVAPLSWVVHQDGIMRCFWPSLKNRERIRAAVRQEIPPMKSVWQNYEVRILHKFRTFEEALAKVPHFEEFSDLSEAEGTPTISTPTEFSKSGRPIKKTKLEFGGEAVRPRKPPVHARESSSLALDLPEFPNSPVDLDSQMISVESEEVLKFSTDAAESEHFDATPYTEVVFPNPVSHFSTDFMVEFKEFQSICLRNFATIQANQSATMKMVEAIMYNSRATASQSTVSIPVRPNFGFPFRAAANLMEFDRKLGEDQEFRAACIKYLGTIGGSDLTTSVFEPLKKIMTYEVAYTFNYTGVNGKSNFSTLNLNDIIFDLVRANPPTAHETMVNVRNKIKNWVLHAGDKLPKEMKRLNQSNEETEG